MKIGITISLHFVHYRNQCRIKETCGISSPSAPQRGAADAEIKVPLVENTELEGSPCKAWEYIAIHATLTARDFFLANFYHFGPFTCIFSNLSRVFHALAVANTSSGAGPQNTIGHPAHRYGQLRQVLSARGI